MKQYIGFAPFFVLLFLLVGAKTLRGEYSPSPVNYCNSRYDFCLTYPGSLLTVKQVSDNEDGVLLMTADHRVKVSANGSYNVLQWAP